MEDCLKDYRKNQYVRCLKCNKIIVCLKHDTTKLIEHIRMDHPEVSIIDSSSENDMKGPRRRSESGEGDTRKVNAKSINSKSNLKREAASGIHHYDNCMTKSQRGHLFRTSIEHWRPANGTIFCPFCSCKKQPLVKMRNERLSGNSWTANCLLACWPFCFLPFMIPGNDKEYLYCANCKCFLGLYDRDNNCIRPNRQFSERMSKKQQNESRKSQ